MRQVAPLKSLASRLGTFLASNALGQALNFIVGLTILWMLPIPEYALYTTCLALITIGNVGSDSGLSQAMVTFGSRVSHNRAGISGVFATCWALRRKALLVVSLPVLASIAFIGYRQHWSLQGWLTALLLVLATNWAQLRLTPYSSLFNIYQDTRAIFLSSTAAALLRLVLTVLLCRRWPLASVVLAINLAGFLLQYRLADAFASHRIDRSAAVDPATRREILQFVKPLIPGLIYFILQGQIVIYLLTWTGQITAIAEIGALGRLAQVFLPLSVLNSFFILPHFARLADPARFRRRLGMLGLVAIAGSVVAMLSAIWLDNWWVLLLGSKYAHLQPLIPLAMAGCVAALLGAAMYTVVIATGHTRLQWIQIPLGISAQLAVIAAIGIQSTRDALLISYAPTFSYLVLEVALTGVAVRQLSARRVPGS